MRIDAGDLYRKIRHGAGRLPVFAVAVAIGIAARVLCRSWRRPSGLQWVCRTQASPC